MEETHLDRVVSHADSFIGTMNSIQIDYGNTVDNKNNPNQYI